MAAARQSQPYQSVNDEAGWNSPLAGSRSAAGAWRTAVIQLISALLISSQLLAFMP
jgi:hypothetical protein